MHNNPKIDGELIGDVRMGLNQIFKPIEFFENETPGIIPGF